MKTNVKRIADKKLGVYLADNYNKFCQDCGDLTPVTQLFAQLYMNGLYGYTCLDCNK